MTAILNYLLDMQEELNPIESTINKIVNDLEETDFTHYEMLSILSGVKKKLIANNKESVGDSIKSQLSNINYLEPYKLDK